MNRDKFRRYSRKRPADHLESERVAKKTKYTSTYRQHINNEQQNTTREWQSENKNCNNILPSVDELHQEPGISPHVQPHIVKGNYKSWQHYLDTQFNLLKEDFVAPLRKKIHDYREEFNIDQQATFTEMVLNEHGILLSVEFKAPQNVNWSQNLINGTLLCFSLDNFDTIIFATVINQKDQCQNKIQVKMESDIGELSMLGLNENNITHSQEYAVIEAPAHYETYYHFLSSLKSINPNKMPFKNYLIDFNYHKMRHPYYLSRNSIFSMAEVLQFKKDSHHPANFNIFKRWPSHEITGLNESQIKALQMALTHKVALIQGPPGTGKTFIGEKIVETLLINKTKWYSQNSSPILVVCYTNHALDQFLEKIVKIKNKLANSEKSCKNTLTHTIKIVRLGGGCKSDKVEECLIKHLNSKKVQETDKRNVKTTASHITKRYFSLRTKLAKTSKKIKKLMELLVDNNPPWIEDLFEFIAPVHVNQLSKLHEKNCIKVWLNQKQYYHHNICEGEQLIDSNNWLERTGYALHDINNQENKKDFAVVKVKNSQFKYVESQIAYTTAEVENIFDINVLSLHERKKLYHYWIRRYHNSLYNEICSLIGKFKEDHAEFIEVHNKKDAELLQGTTIIGMTNTGAAKHRHLLEKLKPKIVIVEEAAEVLESHIIPCLTSATEHLILIGDHKQLQPKPHEHQLACKYNLNISLFERLILHNIPSVELTVQYRMRPEIAGLICPHIYSNLQNAEKVTQYKNIRGIKTNIYFFNHKYKESLKPNSHSYFNAREADLVVGLCNYLLKLDYEPRKITVLAAYASQVTQLQKLILDSAVNPQVSQTEEVFEDEQFVTIKTVDNYQGEENDIIILSLVRNNDDDDPGFLKFNNRVCVALSRARKGLYCFGNFDLLYKCKSEKPDKIPVWQKILDDLKNKNQIGSALKLCCVNHPELVTTIKQPDDFQRSFRRWL